MPDSLYSDLLLLRDINFFPHLDPNQPNLPSGNDHRLECPHSERIDDCLSCLFGNQTGHGPGQCDLGCPRTVVTAVSGGHLNTSHFEFPLQDILLHTPIWRPQTVRVTSYVIVSISTCMHALWLCWAVLLLCHSIPCMHHQARHVFTFPTVRRCVALFAV